MEQIEKLYYSVGEVAKMLDVPTHTIRNLSDEFGVKPRRNSAGERRYTRSEIGELRILVELNSLSRSELILRVINAEFIRTKKAA